MFGIVEGPTKPENEGEYGRGRVRISVYRVKDSDARSQHVPQSMILLHNLHSRSIGDLGVLHHFNTGDELAGTRSA